MKNLILVGSIFVTLSNSGFAGGSSTAGVTKEPSPRIGVLRCHQDVAGADYGLSIEIDDYPNPMHSQDRFTIAKVFENTIAGPQLQGEYRVKMLIPPTEMLGAPIKFSGKYFSLVVYTTATPHHSAHPSRLKAKSANGRMMEAQVDCQFIR